MPQRQGNDACLLAGTVLDLVATFRERCVLLAAIERAEFVHFTFRIVVAKFSECQDRRKNICSPEPMKALFRCSALGHFSVTVPPRMAYVFVYS
jgi:hypothetical protein